MQVLRRRTAAALAIGAAAALVLAGCGSDGESGGAPVTAVSAPAPAASAPAADGGVTSVFARMSTAMGQAQSVRGTTTTTTPDGAAAGEFAFEFTDRGLRAEFAMDQSGQQVSGVLTPDAIYVAGAGVPLPGGKTHVKVPLGGTDGLGAGFGVLADSLARAGDFEALAEQWGGLGDLRAAGTETVEGVQTTKYVGTLDPSNPPAGASKEVKELYSTLASAGSGPITTTIWLDAQDRPVKVETKSTGENPSSTVVVYSGWGEDVTVTVPDASKVAELPKL